MLPVVWLSDAIEDAENIVTYVAERNPSVAEKIRDALVACTEYAADHPYMYRRSPRILGTREITIHPYKVLYRVSGDRLEVVAVIHVRQEFPKNNHALR